MTKRRKFFEDYAEANNFDPLVRENWYSQPTDKIRAAKVITFLLLICFVLFSFALLCLLINFD